MTITPQSILRFTVGLAVTAVILYLMWFFSAVVIYILVSAVLAVSEPRVLQFRLFRQMRM